MQILCLEVGDIRKKTKDRRVVATLNIVSFIALLLMVAFSVLLVLSRNTQIQAWYQTYLEYLLTAEERIENLDDRSTILLIIIFLFAFKAVFPLYLYPLSLLCAVTSTVFPAYFSIPINLVGIAILYSIRYYWGKKVGADGVQNILKINSTVRYLVENDGQGNPWLLAALRLLPGIPINLVSKLYGAMGLRYRDFLWLSILGFSPLLISYTFIGRNVFNPLSAAFLVPFIIIFLIIAVSSFTLSRMIKIQSKRRKKNA